MVDSGKIVIIDNGSGVIKAGFGGEGSQGLGDGEGIFPSIVGRPKPSRGAMMGRPDEDDGDIYIGEDATSKKGVLDLTNPI